MTEKRKVAYRTDISVSLYDLEGDFQEVQANLAAVFSHGQAWLAEFSPDQPARLYLEWMTIDSSGRQELVMFYERDETDKEYAIRVETEEELQTAQERRERAILADLSMKYYGTPTPNALS